MVLPEANIINPPLVWPTTPRTINGISYAVPMNRRGWNEQYHEARSRAQRAPPAARARPLAGGGVEHAIAEPIPIAEAAYAFHSGVVTNTRSLPNRHVSSGRPHPNLFGSAPAAVSMPNVIQENMRSRNLPDVSTTTSTIYPEPPSYQAPRPTAEAGTQAAPTAVEAGTQAGVATAEGGSQTPPAPVTTDIGTQTDINKVKDPKFDKLINLMLGFYGTPQKHVNEAAPRRTLDYTTIARPPMPAPVRSRLDIVKSHPNNILDISPPKCTIGLTTDNVFQHGGLAT